MTSATSPLEPVLAPSPDRPIPAWPCPIAGPPASLASPPGGWARRVGRVVLGVASAVLLGDLGS